MLEENKRRQTGWWGLKPAVDALIVGLIVFSSFVGSAFLVHSTILTQAEIHRHAMIESAAWKAAASASRFLSASGNLEKNDVGPAKKAFAELQAEGSSIQSVSLLVKDDQKLESVLHVNKKDTTVDPAIDAIFQPSSQDRHESHVALVTGGIRVIFPDKDSTVAYARFPPGMV